MSDRILEINDDNVLLPPEEYAKVYEKRYGVPFVLLTKEDILERFKDFLTPEQVEMIKKAKD